MNLLAGRQTVFKEGFTPHSYHGPNAQTLHFCNFCMSHSHFRGQFLTFFNFFPYSFSPSSSETSLLIFPFNSIHYHLFSPNQLHTSYFYHSFLTSQFCTTPEGQTTSSIMLLFISWLDLDQLNQIHVKLYIPT